MFWRSKRSIRVIVCHWLSQSLGLVDQDWRLGWQKRTRPTLGCHVLLAAGAREKGGTWKCACKRWHVKGARKRWHVRKCACKWWRVKKNTSIPFSYNIAEGAWKRCSNSIAGEGANGGGTTGNIIVWSQTSMRAPRARLSSFASRRRRPHDNDGGTMMRLRDEGHDNMDETLVEGGVSVLLTLAMVQDWPLRALTNRSKWHRQGVNHVASSVVLNRTSSAEVVPRFEPFERCCMAILFCGRPREDDAGEKFMIFFQRG